MSDPAIVMASASGGIPGLAGFAAVAEAGPQGMITLRADLADPALAAALAGAGLPGVPAQRKVIIAEAATVAWMSPDELLIVMPHAAAPGMVATLSAALSATHALVAEVSEARARFLISGPKAVHVLMKLCPVDFPKMAKDEIRRTRAAQVAAAIWRSGEEEWSLVCFRSVSAYMAELLRQSARHGSELYPVV